MRRDGWEEPAGRFDMQRNLCLCCVAEDYNQLWAVCGEWWGILIKLIFHWIIMDHGVPPMNAWTLALLFQQKTFRQFRQFFCSMSTKHFIEIRFLLMNLGLIMQCGFPLSFCSFIVLYSFHSLRGNFSFSQSWTTKLLPYSWTHLPAATVLECHHQKIEIMIFLTTTTTTRTDNMSKEFVADTCKACEQSNTRLFKNNENSL